MTYLGEKSHVGMELCFLCNEPKGIMLDTRLRNTLPRQAVYNHEPCDNCKEHMKQGIILISMNEKLTHDRENPYRTGGWSVVTEEAVRKVFPPDMVEGVLKKRVCFVSDGIWDLMNLPRPKPKEK